jgi:hypothetical protein
MHKIMGTRGAIGFRSNERDYIAYNHFDSYPSGLGVEFLNQARNLAKLKPATIRRKISGLQVITKNGRKPTPAEQKKLAPWSDFTVNGGQKDDWYCLLRKAQGSLPETLKAGFMGDNASFLANSLFCEWAYIINFDNRTIEIYKGFNKKPNGKGRYAKLVDDYQATKEGGPEFYGVVLVNSYSLDDLPSDEDFLKAMKKFDR